MVIIETLNAQIIDCTTTQSMCLGCPKRPRSSAQLESRPEIFPHKGRANSARPPWHGHALSHAHASSIPIGW